VGFGSVIQIGSVNQTLLCTLIFLVAEVGFEGDGGGRVDSSIYVYLLCINMPLQEVKKEVNHENLNPKDENCSVMDI